MATWPPDGGSLVVVTATRLEAWAARRVLRSRARVLRVGVGLKGGAVLPADATLLSCGLAGALSPALRPGTVLIPAWVGLPSGERWRCHPPLVEVLVAASRRLGHEPVTEPLLTVSRLLTGRDRQDWLAQGFVGVEMETGFLLERHPRVAAVRVVLDTPRHELSPRWERPESILSAPSLWPQAARISLTAPGYASRVAAVVREAMRLARR